MGGRTFGRVDLVDRSDHATDRRAADLCAARSVRPRRPGDRSCDPEGSSGGRVRAEYENAPVAPDQAVARTIAPAVQAAEGRKKRRWESCCRRRFRRRGIADSPLGNLFTDAYRAGVPGADVSINNTSGGLRADLPAGPLTYGAVFEVMPFDNRLVTFHLTGAELRKVLAESDFARAGAGRHVGAAAFASPANAGRSTWACCGPTAHR